MPRWTWHNEPIHSGHTLPPNNRANAVDCLIVDIDGVIADASHRQHHLDGPRKKWQSFFKQCPHDTVIQAGTKFLHEAQPGVVRVLLTARPETIHDETLAWLTKHQIPFDVLIMRSNRDHGPSPTMKRTALQELRAKGFNPVLAVDDDKRNIKMFASEDVPTHYLHSGYHEA